MTFVAVDDEVAKEVNMDHSMHSTDMHSTDMPSMDMDSMNSTCSFSSDMMHGGMMQVSIQPPNATLMLLITLVIYTSADVFPLW